MLTIISALKSEIEPIIDFFPPTPVLPCAHGALRRYQRFDLLRTGPGHQRASKTLQTYLQHTQPDQVLLVGFAGALAPHLNIGQIFQVNEVCLPQGASIVLPPFNLGQNLPQARLLTVETPVEDSITKQNLYQRTGAQLVDMEGYYLAQLFQSKQISFSIVKGISDQAQAGARTQFKQNIKQLSQKLFAILKPFLQEGE